MTPTRLGISKKRGYSLKISAIVGVSFDIHDLRLVYVFSIADLIEGMFSEEGLSRFMSVIHSLVTLLSPCSCSDPGLLSQVILRFV